MKDEALQEHFEKIDDRMVAACATLRILGSNEALSKNEQLLAQEAYDNLVASLGYLGEIRDGVVTLEIKLGMVEEKINDSASPF
jgi:hypothetical protein